MLSLLTAFLSISTHLLLNWDFYESNKEQMSDLEIAKQIELKHIKSIAAKLGLDEDDLEMYGKYKAKLHQPQLEKGKQPCLLGFLKV